MLGDEGCLSVPEIYDKVPRHARVRVRAADRSGQVRELDAEACSRSRYSTRWIICSARSSSST